MRFRHADLRIRARALLLADHERDDTSQIRLEREELQVEHQRQVILEHRRHTLRLVERGQLDVALLFGLLNPAFDVANGLGVLLDLRLVLRAQLLSKRRKLVVDGVQQALLLRSRASRAALPVLPLSPNSRSNTARGLCSIGSGCVALRQEIVCV